MGKLCPLIGAGGRVTYGLPQWGVADNILCHKNHIGKPYFVIRTMLVNHVYSQYQSNLLLEVVVYNWLVGKHKHDNSFSFVFVHETIHWFSRSETIFNPGYIVWKPTEIDQTSFPLLYDTKFSPESHAHHAVVCTRCVLTCKMY